MTDKRRDSGGRELFCREYEREDGRYAFRYKTREGKNGWIYAYRLSDLRNEEAKIAYREFLNISKTIHNITLNDQFEIWIAGNREPYFRHRNMLKSMVKVLGVKPVGPELSAWLCCRHF